MGLIAELEEILQERGKPSPTIGQDTPWHMQAPLRQFNRDKTYTFSDMPDIIPEGKQLTGTQAYNLLRDSGWKTITELSKEHNRAPDQLKDKILEQQPGNAVLYQFGERMTYLFSPQTVVSQLRNTRHTIKPDSLEGVSSRLGTTTSIVRALARRLSLGGKVNNRYSLSEEDIAAIADAIAKEQTPKQGPTRLRDRAVLTTIREIDRDKIYTHNEFHAIPAGTEVSGAQAYDLFVQNGWKTLAELSIEEKRDPTGLRRTLTMNRPEDAIRYRAGESTTYLFHPQTRVPPRRVARTAEPDSPQGVAQRLSTTACRVRALAQKLGLGKQVNGRQELSEHDIAAIGGVLASEQKQYELLLKKVDPVQKYSISELRAIGVPTSKFCHDMRKGMRLEQRGKCSVVAGSEVIRYLREEYDPSSLSSGLRLIARCRPQLYSKADIIRKAGIPHTTAQERLQRLIKEQPESCFQLVDSRGKTHILATAETINAITDWEHRGERQLLHLVDRYILSPARKEVRDAIAGLESLVEDDEIIPLESLEQAFTYMQELYEYQKQALPLERSRVALQDLRLLRDYMKAHNYAGLQLDRIVSPEEIDELMTGVPFAAEVGESIKRGEDALFLSTAYLIDSFQPRRNVPEYERFATEHLFKLIRAYKPGKTIQDETIGFPVFAGHYLDLLAQKVAVFGKDSDAAITSAGSVTIYNNTMPTAARRPEAYAIAKDYSAKVRDALCSTLQNGELEFVKARFGIGMSRLSDRELKARFGLSANQAAELESRVLQALQQSESMQRIRAELL
jgi:hypothetical protein